MLRKLSFNLLSAAGSFLLLVALFNLPSCTSCCKGGCNNPAAAAPRSVDCRYAVVVDVDTINGLYTLESFWPIPDVDLVRTGTELPQVGQVVYF